MMSYANYAACEGDVAKLFHFVLGPDLRTTGGLVPGSSQGQNS